MKRPDRLIAAGLLGSVLTGAVSVLILWIAGRSAELDWPLQAALDHPVWLATGEVLGAIACALAAASLSVLGIRHGGSSAFTPFGIICLVVSIPGVALVGALDLAYARAAQDGVLEAIFFGQRWNWWNALGWVLFAIGGFLGLVSLGLGFARGNRMLRYPGLALAASVFVMFLFPPAGILVAASLIWIALAVWRADSNVLRAGGAPHPAR